MKATYMNYGMHEIRLKRGDIDRLTCPGDCTQSALEIVQEPYIRKQLKRIPDKDIYSELEECGAWEPDELEDRAENEVKLIWVMAGRIDQ